MRKIYGILFLAASLFICSHLHAQSSNIYLKIDGVDGAVTRVGFEKAIEIFSYSQGNAGCPSGVTIKDGACKVVPSSFYFMMGSDAAQIALKKLLFTSKAIPLATISFVKAGGDGSAFVYYTIRLENLLIGSIQESGSSEPPIFSLELLPQKIVWTQFEQKADGTVGKKAIFGWDIAKNAEYTPAN